MYFQAPSALIQSFRAGIEAERLCRHLVSFVRGGFRGFDADYPFLVKGNPQFEDYQYPSEVCVGSQHPARRVSGRQKAAPKARQLNLVIPPPLLA